MDVDSLLDSAALLLGLAAGGGLVMLFQRFGQQRNPPAWLAMAHGFLAAAGLTLLAYAAFRGSLPSTSLAALGLLVAGALGGVILNLRDHWNHVLLSKPWVIGHTLLVVLGFGLLARDAWFA